MTVAQTVQDSVNNMPAGRIFGYQALPGYAKSPGAVIKAVGRLVENKKLARISKGRFYVPESGLLGERRPSDSELIRSVLYKDGRLRGYVTGTALYHQLGLTTQVPRTIRVAVNGGYQIKDLGRIRIKTVATRIPVKKEDVRLLQYLDVLKDIKKIPDSEIDLCLKIMRGYISKLSAREKYRLATLALDYYSPQARALTGLLLTSLGWSATAKLALSLNPTTLYKLNLDVNQWPLAGEWNIR